MLWHYKDPRLQTQQEVQEARDRAYNYVAEYRVAVEEVHPAGRRCDAERDGVDPKQSRWGFGSDDREYELMGSLDGRRHEDVFVIDLTTGARKIAVPHLRYFSGASPDGIEAPLLRRTATTTSIRSRPGRTRTSRRGWRCRSSTSKTITTTSSRRSTRSAGRATAARCCSATRGTSGRCSVEGGAAVNLTVNGKKDAIRYQRRFALEPPRRARRRASTCRSRSTSAPTASGRRRRASRASIRASPA